MSNLGSRLKDLRKAEGLTIEHLARELGVTKGYISEIENSKKEPSLQLLKAIAVKFASSEHWLLTGEGPRDLADTSAQTAPAEVVEPQLAELLAAQAAWWKAATPEQRVWLRVHLRQTVPGFGEKTTTRGKP